MKRNLDVFVAAEQLLLYKYACNAFLVNEATFELLCVMFTHVYCHGAVGEIQMTRYSPTRIVREGVVDRTILYSIE